MHRSRTRPSFEELAGKAHDDRARKRIARQFWGRAAVLSSVDAALWATALSLSVSFRFGFDWSQVDGAGLAATTATAIGAHLIAGTVAGLYSGRRRLASFEETRWLAMVTLSAATTALIVSVGRSPHLVPGSAIIAGTAYQLIGGLGVRYAARMTLDMRRPTPSGGTRTLVFGAGEAGLEVVRGLLRDPASDMLPVALLDDDRLKKGLRLEGLKVVGSRHDIAAAAAQFSADSIIIAVPAAPQPVLVEVADKAQQAGMKVHVLPRLSRLLETGVRVREIREITLADFLGRDEVRLNVDRVSRFLEGKRVLVTGAGGSIGSELCATILEFKPDRLIMLDHSEHNLHRLRQRIGESTHNLRDLVLTDIRDKSALRNVFEQHQPEVVFHAAAHKHVPLLELNPAEAIKTNVFGTLNVLTLASEFEVERLVNISTDKAADPVNMLGMSKRLAERLTAFVARETDGVFLSVRFGNVLGSDGSVIPTFWEQLANGRPITVTHPEVTRYFMTTPEAVQLVLEAASIGTAGDLFVLEMGTPVRIVDLANRLAAVLRPGLPPDIVFTGLRPGEKLHEVLFSDEDEILGRPHDQLWRCAVPAMDPGTLNGLATREDLEGLLWPARVNLEREAKGQSR